MAFYGKHLSILIDSTYLTHWLVQFVSRNLPSSLNLYLIVRRLSFAVLSSKNVGAESGSSVEFFETGDVADVAPAIDSRTLVLCIHS